MFAKPTFKSNTSTDCAGHKLYICSSEKEEEQQSRVCGNIGFECCFTVTLWAGSRYLSGYKNTLEYITPTAGQDFINYILKGYPNDLVLHFHKVGGLTRDGF